MSERDKELSLVQHLGELRDRLMVASIAVVATTAISFFFATDIIKILLIPAGVDRLIALTPTENFTTYMRVALFSGIAFAMPVILYEIYAYIDPALHPNERRFALTAGPFVLLLFVVGMLFCYYALLPSSLKFLVNFGSEVIENQLRASEYLSFVTTFILGMGLVFEVPVIIFALVRVHVLNRAKMMTGTSNTSPMPRMKVVTKERYSDARSWFSITSLPKLTRNLSELGSSA